MSNIVLFVKELCKPLYLQFKKSVFISSYRQKNKHNSTFPVNIFNLDNVNVGKLTYGNLRVIDYDKGGSKLYIGNFCSIAEDVAFLLNGEHNYKLFSTFPFYDEDDVDFKKTKGDIIVEDDVWIGYHSMILSGVTIGQGTIISAGSIVSKDIPPYSIYIKDKIYKKRFTEKTIEKLKQIDFFNVNLEEINNSKLSIFTEELNDLNVDILISELNRLERK